MARAGDLLADYRRKRDFSRTAEPKGAKGKDRGNSFVVQKHDATRLHYDFRIELDGVLKSWAVTKGPSNDPADKRLAVRVEDHPLDYGGFEGTIPKGQYGGGTVMLWDRGTWEPIGDPHEGLAKGDLKIRLFGERMKGEWVLVHMKGRDNKLKSGEVRENWLLIKHHDDYSREGDTLTDRFTRSVSTGRDMEGIAKGLKPRKETSTPQAAIWNSDPDKAGANTPAPPRPSKPAGRRASGKRLPAFVPPQLATLVDRVPPGNDWLFEMKYDGYRCIAAISGGTVKLYTRNGLDWTEKFGALVEPFSALTEGSALIDGEICAFKDGRTDFSALKDALSNGGALTFFAFDLLEKDGVSLRNKPLRERKAALEELIGRRPHHDAIQFSPDIEGHGEKVFNTICAAGHEGVIAKKADAPYRSARTKSWLKVKCTRRQEFIIVGWSPSEKRRNVFASLLLATQEGGTLVYRGRVGTGFGDADRASLQQSLLALERKTAPLKGVPRPMTRGVHWVEPKLLAEIAFTEVTPDGALRHPSFLGLREDKMADGIRLETPAPLPGREGKGMQIDLSIDRGVAAAEKAGVRLTSPDKVLFPNQGITKAQLVAYYAAVVDAMMPFIADRPLSLVRCPEGRAKQCFFQKHDTGGFAAGMKSVDITEKSGEPEDYFYIDDLAGLIAGVQMGVLEFHLWGVRRDEIEKPERLIFDIDPDEGLDFTNVKEAAFDMRDRLAELGLKSFPMVTGGKGVHVIVPLVRRAGWDEAKRFAAGFAKTLAAEEPDRFVAVATKAKRKGRMFIDYLRNERGSTAIAPYSTRSREGAPVATPVTWDELAILDRANAFSLTVAATRAQEPSRWPDYFTLRQSLTAKMIKAVT